MSGPCLLPEILDCAVDLLYNEPETLKTCCLVSKSWVPRTRRHLFADIKFRSAGDLRLWKKTFPDVANSPAYHTRTLFIGCPAFVVAADTEEGGWLRPFSGVTSLDVDNGKWLISTLSTPLVSFFKFASTFKSLSISPILLPCPELFNFIRSSPQLEDLSLMGDDKSLGNDDNQNRSQPVVSSTSPPLTGTLSLTIFGGMGGTVRHLLDLQSDLRFGELKFVWDRKEDLRWITKLVEECSHTLESLYVACILGAGSDSASIDLSKATRLMDVAFRYESQNIDWITKTLQTITPEHRDFRQITIFIPCLLTVFNVNVGVNGPSLDDAIARQWLDLDHLLFRFWETRSIRPRVLCPRLGDEWRNTETCIGCLLQKITEGGILDLFEYQ